MVGKRRLHGGKDRHCNVSGLPLRGIYPQSQPFIYEEFRITRPVSKARQIPLSRG
jgi:hypothetical protein